MARRGGPPDLYDAADDPYFYRGTSILKNIPDLRSQKKLDRFETVHVTQRGQEPLPDGRLSVQHYRAIHRHLFQDVYAWAGSFRTVRVAKGKSVFCYPEHITREMKALFETLRRKKYLRDLTSGEFVTEAASFLATLNAIHPFREGNGRTQLIFLALLAARADHGLDLEALKPRSFLRAMIRSFHGETDSLVEQLRRITA